MTIPKHGMSCIACEGDIATCGCWDESEPRPGLVVVRDENGEVRDSFMADCICNHDWITHPDTGCLGIDTCGCECECPGYEPSIDPCQ